MSRHLPQSLCRLQSRAHSAAPPPKMLHLLHSNERGERKREREKGGGEDMCPHSQTLTQKQHLNTTYVKARNSLTQTSTGADSTEQRLIRPARSLQSCHQTSRLCRPSPNPEDRRWCEGSCQQTASLDLC